MGDPRIPGRLQADLDGQLPPAGKAWVREHLSAHPEAAADQAERAALARRLRVDLAGMPVPALDADRRAAIWAAAAMPPPRIRRFRPWHGVLAAACLALAVGMLSLVRVDMPAPQWEESPPVRIATMVPDSRTEQTGRPGDAAFVGGIMDQRRAIEGLASAAPSPITTIDIPVVNEQSEDDSDRTAQEGREEAVAEADMGGMGAFMAIGAGGGGRNTLPRTKTAAKVDTRPSGGQPMAPPPVTTPPTTGESGRSRAAYTFDGTSSAQPAKPARPNTPENGVAVTGTRTRTMTAQGQVEKLNKDIGFDYEYDPRGPAVQPPLWQGVDIPRARNTELTHIAQVGRGVEFALNVRLADGEDDLSRQAGGKPADDRLDTDHRRLSESIRREMVPNLEVAGPSVPADLLPRLRTARTAGRQLVLQDGQAVERAPIPLDPADLGGLDAAAFTRRWGAVPMLPVAVRADQTFALNADTALVDQFERLLRAGTLPDPDLVRPEQFVNAMPADHPAPTGEPVALYAEAAPHPLIDDGRTLLVAVTAVTRAPTPGERRPMNLVVCLDASGSMTGDGLARAAAEIRGLLAAAKPEDRIGIVTFADRGRVLVAPGAATGDRVAALSAALARVEPQATTDVVDGLRLAYRLAADGAAPDRASLVLLLTDGATLAPALVDDAVAAVGAFRGRGIQLVAGVVGAEPAQPLAIQRLAERGDGRVVDLARSPLGLVPERLAALVADAKCQVVWNPDRVAQARLVGYREHRLKAEDFRNDAVDAAEIAADTRVTALFEIVPVEGGSGPFGTARVRYRDLREQRIVEQALPLGGTILARQPSPQLRLWAVAAATGEWLERGWWSNARAWDRNRLLAALVPVDAPALAPGAHRLRAIITAAAPHLR